ncbi:hypothetical protein TNCV_2413891 [Trichonephila clavipes]|nr:hypothetical protein TNCV_2413891 [Trichonephila clavipes]
MTFELFTDANLIGFGTVIAQDQRPIVYASRTLNITQRNYTVSERECLAVIWARNKFRTYLGPLSVKVITDYTALTKLTYAELFLGRKLITPLQKLVVVADGAECVVGNIEKLFKEAGQNTRIKHEKWEKYHNKRRREVNIRVNNLVLVETHPISSTKEKAHQFKSKFDGPYRFLSVRNNKVVIWKEGKTRCDKVQEKEVPASRSVGPKRKKEGQSETNKRALMSSSHPPSSKKRVKIQKRTLGRLQLKSYGQVQKKGRFSQAGSSKDDQALITSEAEETSQGTPVLDLQEEQCKRREDQSVPEKNHLVGQALIQSIIYDSPENKVAKTLKRVQKAEDQALTSPDHKVDRSLKRVQEAEDKALTSPENKVDRSLKRVQEAEDQALTSPDHKVDRSLKRVQEAEDQALTSPDHKVDRSLKHQKINITGSPYWRYKRKEL